ncbi:MAG: hypothetical protein LIP23_07730, partial [Planctomycetes bacterium]|nr:hypothetical protein [Planctomycetota bacterium]
VCDKPIGPNPEQKGRGMILPEAEGGKTARTDFSIVEKGADWALAEAAPKTGRPHQIRVHAASLGFPLAGDADYNTEPGRLGFARQALHAHSLLFIHPATGREMQIQAPLPDDMAEGLERLRCREKAVGGASNHIGG